MCFKKIMYLQQEVKFNKLINPNNLERVPFADIVSPKIMGRSTILISGFSESN
jgi:hypothetical protein